MADKYLKLNSGVPTEVEATVTSAGAGNAGDVVALDGNGRLDLSVMPTSIGADTATITASENLSANDFVNVFNDGGTAKMRKADASTAGKEAHGFVLAAVLQDAAGECYFEGENAGLSGLTPGVVWLSAATPGASVSTPPSAAGNIVQKLGVAVSAMAINVECGQPYVLS